MILRATLRVYIEIVNMTTHEHWKESHSMSVLQFAEYYEGSYPQAFVVDRVPTGHALWEG